MTQVHVLVLLKQRGRCWVLSQAAVDGVCVDYRIPESEKKLIIILKI
jgi:hypothetical protein